MEFNLNVTTQARFKLVVSENGKVTKETPEFENIVLDQGIERMFVGTWHSGVQVGTGNSTPTPAQTQLDSFLAHSTTNQGTQTHGVDVENSYIWGKRVVRFNEGVAVGNISEVAVSWGNQPTSIWNRSLVKDVNGNPTSITVLSSEVLDVYIEFRLYVPKTITGSFVLVDKNNNPVSTHTYTGAPKMVSAGFNTSAINLFGSSSSGLPVFTGSLPTTPTTDPTGLVGGGGIESSSKNTVSLGELVGTAVIGLNEANGTHRTVTIPVHGFMTLSINPFRYYVEMNPPITLKNNTRKIEYTFRIKIERHT